MKFATVLALGIFAGNVCSSVILNDAKKRSPVALAMPAEIIEPIEPIEPIEGGEPITSGGGTGSGGDGKPRIGGTGTTGSEPIEPNGQGGVKGGSEPIEPNGQGGVKGEPEPTEPGQTAPEQPPEVVELGVGPGFGKVDTLSSYQTKGNQRYTAFEDAKLRGTDDTPILADRNEAHIPASFPDLFEVKDHYFVDSKPGKTLDDYDPEIFLFTKEELGVDLPATHTEVKVFSVRDGKTVGQSDDPNREFYILRGGYTEDGQIIFAKDAFKDNDVTPTGDGKIPINEISWQTYASVAKDNTKNLKAIMLMDIQNKGFWAITAANYGERGIPLTQKAVWRRGDADNTKWFERLLGSDNINSKIFAFTNHHNALGNPNIDSIVTIPKMVPGSGFRMIAALVLKAPAS
jgi:hypothetical protein